MNRRGTESHVPIPRTLWIMSTMPRKMTRQDLRDWVAAGLDAAEAHAWVPMAAIADRDGNLTGRRRA
jgi:hypothetical protein